MHAQVYTHPTTGIANEFVGSCEVATCAGTYYDDGGVGGSTTLSGAAGNYSNNIGGIYRVFCPNAAGQCLTATFTQFSTEGGFGCPYDYFVVSNGSTQNSPALFGGCGTGAIGPFTGTINGCLGFRFWSDGSVNRAGWAATFSCAPCAGGPTGTSNNDCANFTQVCASTPVASNSTGPGILAEGCGGASCPAGGENYSNWFAVSIAASGTFGFTIVPTVGTDDYDYAVYGPTASCGTLGASIRCSDAGLTGNTGLSAAAVDVSEDVNGDRFTAEITAAAGDVYYIMVDEWTPTGAGYNLNFTGTASISCTPLPVELITLNAKYQQENKSVYIDWKTASETNNDYFTIERSLDGVVWEQIDVIDGHGTTSQQHSYVSIDHNPYPGEINYYRLKQVDLDGAFKIFNTVAIFINDPVSQFSIYPNPANENATIEFNIPYENECIINIYDFTAKQILSHKFTSVKGKNLIPLDLKGFSTGIYFVTFSDKVDFLKTTFIKK